MSYTDNSYFQGQGVVSIQRRLFNGAPLSGFIDIGDADKFNLSPKQTFDDIKESRTGQRFTAAHNVTGTDLSLELNLLQFQKSNLVAGLWGADTGSVPAGTVTAELQTAYNNSIVPLANPGVSAVVSKLAGLTGTIASIAVTAAGTGYTANTAFALTITGAPGTGATGVAISDNSGRIVGAYVTAAGTGYVAPTATITTPGGGVGTTFQVNMGAATLTLNTDYTVDAANGALTILPGSLLVPSFVNSFGVAPDGSGGVSLTNAYSYAAYTGNVEVFARGMQYYAVRLHGINVTNNQPVIATAYQCAYDVTKMLSLIDAKHTSLDLSGMLLQDQTKPLATATNPYSQFMRITKA
ncbi:MAG: hypothetical protein B7Z62_02050 [Deltaproteobacteria bacterium 37-65-8]|nr:MAG: hypothetical protein B7Z62_02050 [Deltaproteobacteria bacterium 37-65-8]